MYRLRVEEEFDSAHRLDGYEGKCSRVHGHTWKIEVFVVGEKLDKVGMLVDFRVLRNKLKEIVDRLDHRLLNEMKEIGNPTSEAIARYIYTRLKDEIEGARLERVRVWESSKSWCEYYEEGGIKEG